MCPQITIVCLIYSISALEFKFEQKLTENNIKEYCYTLT